MADYEWPTDPEFRRVAGRIADAVLAAINSGERIGDFSNKHTVCPLACIPGVGCGPRPMGYEVGPVLRCESVNLYDFIIGFEGGFTVGDFYQLGLAYRRRFVDGAK
jgi:hypothetical protein